MAVAPHAPTRHAAAALALLLAASAGCGELRQRPLPMEAGGGGVNLSVDVATSAGTAEHAIAGRTLHIRVHGTETLGRLTGVGYRIERAGPNRAVLDSAAIHFAPRPDSLHSFPVTIPDTLPNNAQIDVYGIAFGPGNAARVSGAKPLLVLRCAPGATWC
jgi:hypothetical protein